MAGSGVGTPVSGVTEAYESTPFFTAVWVWDSSASSYLNQTIEAQTSTGTAFTVLEDSADYLYLGAQSRTDMALFDLSGLGSLSGLVWQYWNGTAWTQFVPRIAYDFSIDGAERFENLVNWTAKAFSNTDPHSGTVPDTSVRYWIRISASTITAAPTVYRIEARPYAAYCRATDVAHLLQLESDFSSTTTPTRDTIENYIHHAQDRIDYLTRKSWRVNAIINEEHDFNLDGVRLLHRDVKRITKLEIWNGADYETKDQGRTQEYFYVGNTGMVHFSRYFMLPARMAGYTTPAWRLGYGEFTFPLRITYHYGRDLYTGEQGAEVQELVEKMAAIDVLNHHDYSILMVSGTDKVTLDRKIENWKYDIEQKLEELRGWVVI